MTDSGMLLIDAEYWASYLVHDIATCNALAKEVEPFIPRLAYLENEYGANRDDNGYWVDDYNAFSKEKREHRCFFALLMSVALKE